jgi:drug/metabolite transporter (DMT)-like permease
LLNRVEYYYDRTRREKPVMVIVFALAAAVMYGSADFLGGAASRQSRALSVAALSVPAGALVMLVAAVLAGGPVPTAGLGWAVAAGAVGAVGLMAFYAGLAVGPMSVVAPVSALMSTVLPVGVAVATGEHLSGRVYAGAATCLGAIVLVSMERGAPVWPGRKAGSGAAKQRQAQPAAARRPDRTAALRGLAYGIVCGTLFGLFFVCLRYAGSSGVFWPVSMARLVACAVVLAAVALTRTRPVGREAGSRVLTATIASGVLDASANLFYVLATRAGLFGIAIVLTSLYPGITVLLARVVLHERMHPVQRAGLVLAAAGVLLVTW